MSITDGALDKSRVDDVSIFITDKYGNRYGEISSAALDSVVWARNDNGAQATVNLSNVDPDAALTLINKRDLQIIFNNVINRDTGLPESFWGTIFQRRGKPGQRQLVVPSAATWLKVRMVDTASLDYSDMEQFDIGWNLVNAAQTGMNRDLNFVSTYSPSGYHRFRRYDRLTHKFYWDALQEFPTLANGFEWNIVPDFTGNVRRWTPYYPQKGSVITDVHFEWGLNIEDYDLDEDGLRMKTKVYAKGATENGVTFEQSYEDATASSDYGQFEATTNDGSQKDIGWLLDKATRIVNLNKSPYLTLKITVKDIPATTLPTVSPGMQIFGNVHDGDTVQVDIDDGANQVHGQMRIDTFTRKSFGTYDITFVNPADQVT